MKKILLYAGYSVLVVVILAYVLFPGQAILEYVQSEVSRRGNGLELSMSRLGVAFPLGVVMRGVVVTDKGKTMLAADSVRITPEYFRLLALKPGFDVRMKCYKGNLKVDTKFLERSLKGPVGLSVEAENLKIDDVGLVTLLTGKPFSGTVNLKADFTGLPSQWTRGTGKLDGSLTDGKMGFLADLIGVDAFSVTRAVVEGELNEGSFAIKKCELGGKELSGTVTGTVALQQPLGRSRLQIKGQVSPAPALFQQLGSSSPVAQMLRSQSTKSGGKIPFSITGTIGANEVSFQ